MTQVESALALQRSGDMQAAHKIYRSILKRHPANSDALHYLGVLLHQTGRHEEAEPLIVRSLKIDNRQTFAHNNLGEIYRAQGKHECAVASYRSAIELSPDYPEALNNLGLCLGALGELDEAVQVLRRAVTLRPDFAEAWIHLGNVYKDQGNDVEAILAYEKITNDSPLFVDAQLNLAGVHLHFGRVEESLHRYEAVCKLSPNSSRALAGMGEANWQLGKLADAEDCLDRALIQAPGEAKLYEQIISLLEVRDATEKLLQICRSALDNGCQTWKIYASYAAALLKTGALQDALNHAELGVEHEPQTPETHNVLGLCLAALGKEEEAIQSFTTALARDGCYVAALNNLGTSYLSLGNKVLATQFLNKALSVDPGYAPALENLSSLVPLNLNDAAQVSRIKELADSEIALISHRASLYFALAKAYEKASMFDQAFEHYSTGNKLRAQSSPYSPSKHEQDMQANIGVFSEAFIRKGFPGASDSRRPIFIVGMPRSGTTLVEQILSSHPDVYGAGELSYFHEIQFRHRESGEVLPYWSCVDSFDEEAVRNLADGYLSMLQEISAETPHVTDKLPMNYFHLGLIHMVFPSAHIIHCARDVRDTCISIFRQNFTFGNDYARDLFDIGHRYRQQVRIMNHWREVIHGRIYDLSYERLVGSAEEEIKSLIEFCGLPWNEACLRPSENKRPVKTASQLQVREPIHNKAMAQWKDYEIFLAELDRGLATDLLGCA